MNKRVIFNWCWSIFSSHSKKHFYSRIIVMISTLKSQYHHSFCYRRKQMNNKTTLANIKNNRDRRQILRENFQKWPVKASHQIHLKCLQI